MRASWAAALSALLLAGCGRFEPAAVPDLPGLGNVFRLSAALYSGSEPQGQAGFRSLKEMGVRTLVSVDGNVPDIAGAAGFGLRYVHVPVGYDGVPEAAAARIAAALRDLPGPTYVHCHRGRHRGPAAAVTALRALDRSCDAAGAVAFLEAAGTDPRYAGLFAAARRAPAAPADVSGEGDPFPARAAVPDATAWMAQVDERWDAVRGSRNPADAVLLWEGLIEFGRASASVARPAAFKQRLDESVTAARELESALRGTVGVDAALARCQRSCAACHAEFRDYPGSR